MLSLKWLLDIEIAMLGRHLDKGNWSSEEKSGLEK